MYSPHHSRIFLSLIKINLTFFFLFHKYFISDTVSCICCIPGLELFRKFLNMLIQGELDELQKVLSMVSI